MSSISNVRASTRATERAAASKQRWRTCVQNRISDFEFLHSSLRFTIARSIRSTAFAIHRVARRIAPGLIRELALDVLHVRAGERSAGHSVDDLLAYAVATDTRLRFFREDVIVFDGPCCARARVEELRAARVALAARIEDLFGVEVSGSPRDVAEREARVAAARTDRPTTAPNVAPPLEPAPPADVVLAPWEVEAESIAPARSSKSSLASDSQRPSRLPEVGAPPPRAHAAPADRGAASALVEAPLVAPTPAPAASASIASHATSRPAGLEENSPCPSK